MRRLDLLKTLTGCALVVFCAATGRLVGFTLGLLAYLICWGIGYRDTDTETEL